MAKVICSCGNFTDWSFDPGEAGKATCKRCGRKFDFVVREARRFSEKRSLCEMPADRNGEEVQ